LALIFLFLSFSLVWVLLALGFLELWGVALGHLFEIFLSFSYMHSWI
jgi:hypothetical protein